MTKNNKLFGSIDIFSKKARIIYLIILSITLILYISFGIRAYLNDKKVITIDKYVYKESDFNIYLYSAKYNYFGSNTSITDDDLKVVYDEDSNMTVGDYLKKVAVSDIKTSSAIKKIADKNNIKLDDNDRKKIKEEKNKYIKQLGGRKEFKKILKANNTTEKAYDKLSENDTLYKKIISELYSKNTINDLTDKEKEEAKEDYQKNYYKIKQIILTIVNIKTGNSLSKTTINQKETLAKNIVEQANNGVDFDELIKKYSEDSTDKEPPYDLYYEKGKLLNELEEAVNDLSIGEVSSPIKTKYAYHIILREELDDKKLESYYDNLREDKCIEDIKEEIKNLKIIYHDKFKSIKVG